MVYGLMMTAVNLDYNIAKALAHPIRWKILQELRKKPQYGKELAQVLGMSEQKIYHHLKILENASIIKINAIESKKGALTKYFTVNPDFNFFFQDFPPSNNDREIFIAEIISNVIINSGTGHFKLVVGNPEPHGPYNAISRDGYLSAVLSWILKKYLPSSYHLKVMTDSEFFLRYSQDFSDLDDPLISIGGPITNVVTNSILTRLKHKKVPIRITGPPWIIKTSSASFQDRTCGLILFYQDRDIFSMPVISFAGIGRRGTLASILALEQASLKNHWIEKEWWSIVVQGLPLHGKKTSDIKHVKVLEFLHG